MSEYFIGAKEIDDLRGQSFEVKSRVLGRKVEFRVSDASVGEPGGPMRGGEATGLCADCLHPDGNIPSFLKIFTSDVQERKLRNRFLMDLGLSGRHWMFSAMPYGVLPQEEIGGVEIVGHLSRRIVDQFGDIAPSLTQFLSEEDPPRSVRKRFAGQLSSAVYALESIGLVHADISLNNVLVGWDEHDGEIAVLCDFDGFYHSMQPPLPLKSGRLDVRKIGTPGFQSPGLLEERENQQTDLEVRTDRFALAALLCQIIVWKTDTAERLQRDELLTNDMIRNRSLSGLPDDLAAAWTDGFGLLQQALHAPSPAHMPSPQDWLEIVGGPAVAPPLLALRNPRENGGEEIIIRLAATGGDFHKVSPELSEVRFRRLSGSVELEFAWSDPVRLNGSFGESKKVDGPVLLRPGSTIISGFWSFRMISDRSKINI